MIIKRNQVWWWHTQYRISTITITPSSPKSWTQTDKPCCRWTSPADVPVLSCSLMRPLISSSWWRSEVSRSGRRSPTLGCSLAMVAAVLGVEAASLSHGVRPSLPGGLLGPPTNTVSRHLYITARTIHKRCPELELWSWISGHVTVKTRYSEAGFL